MAQKLILVLSALVAVSSAVVVPGPGLALPAYPSYPALAKVAAPLVAKVAGPEPYDPNPQYTFSYDVHVSQLRSEVISHLIKSNADSEICIRILLLY